MTQAVALAQLGNSGVNFRNKIINGNFDIWQKGTSHTAAGYTADRWYTTADANSGWTLTQQAFTSGQTEVPNEPTYFMRYAISSSSLTGPTVQQRIEDVRTFAGKTVTVTFYVRASAGSTFTPNYFYMQQNFGSGGSATVNTAPAQSLVALTASWAKHTYTFNIPSIGGKTIGAGNFINIIFRIPDNTVTTVDFAQVQVEEGSIATQFEQRPISVELALCQRYCEAGYTDTSGGYIGAAAVSIGSWIPFAVPKRLNTGMSITTSTGAVYSTATGTWTSQASGGATASRTTGINSQYNNGWNTAWAGSDPRIQGYWWITAEL